MDILSLLLGSDPGILGKLGLGGGQTPPIGIPPGGQPNIQGPPGGVPSMPGNAIPYAQQGGLLGNGMIGNAARGALYGLGAAGQPGPKGFFAGVGRGAQQSIGMQQQRGQYGLGQALGQQELQQRQVQNQMLNARFGMFNQALQRRLGGQANGQAGPDAQGAQMQGAAQSGGAPQGGDLTEYEHYKALAQQTYEDASLGLPGASNELGKHYDDLAAQSLGYKSAAAAAEARAKGFELSRPGAGHFSYDDQGNPVLNAQMPVQMQGRDAQGNPTSNFVFPPTQGGRQGTSGPAPQQGAAGGTNGIDNIYDLADSKYGLPPGSMRTIAGLETAGSRDTGPGSVSPTGQGVGRVQVNPSTVPPGTDLTDPFTSVPIGAKRLAEYTQRYQKYGPQYAPLLGAMAYNAGPKAVDSWILGGAKPDDPKMQGPIHYAQSYVAGIQGPGGNGQALAPQAGGGVPASTRQPAAPGAFTTGLGPQQTEEFKGQGERFNAARTGTQEAAVAAQKHVQLIDQMRAAADDFRMGAGSHLVASAQAWGQYFGITSDEANRQLGSYQDMRKLGVTAGASAIKDVSAREAMQGQKMIWEAQPNPGMSPQGFTKVADSLQAADEAVLAKQQWVAQQPLGTDTDAAWNKATGAQAANAFWMLRMGPTDREAVMKGLSGTDAGKKLLGQMADTIDWLKSQGLAQ